MTNTLIQYLFLLAPVALHSVHDAGEINAGITPKHARNLAILGVVAIALGYFVSLWAVPRVSLWQFVFYTATIHAAIFNYAINRMRRPAMPWFHLGDGPFDSFLKKLQVPGMIFVQGWTLMLGYSVYYHWDWITGKAAPWID